MNGIRKEIAFCVKGKANTDLKWSPCCYIIYVCVPILYYTMYMCMLYTLIKASYFPYIIFQSLTLNLCTILCLYGG